MLAWTEPPPPKKTHTALRVKGESVHLLVKLDVLGGQPGYQRRKRYGSRMLQFWVYANVAPRFVEGAVVRQTAAPPPGHVVLPKSLSQQRLSVLLVSRLRATPPRPEKTKPDEASGPSGTTVTGALLEKGRTARDRGTEGGRGRQRGRVSPRSGGRDTPPPRWASAGAAQGLAGGLGEGHEPWLSKLAVLAFHCRTQGHRRRVSSRLRPGHALKTPPLPPSRTSWAPAGGASARWACVGTPASRSSGPCRAPRRCTPPSSRR